MLNQMSTIWGHNLKLGAVDYVIKPFHREEVKARVRTHLALKKAREDLEKRLKEIQEKTEEIRQKDLQLIEMDRLAGIGTLAAGIAHEINNPLSFIKTSLGFLQKAVKKISSSVSYWDDNPLPETVKKGYQAHLTDINYGHYINSLDSKFDSIEKGIQRIMDIVNNLRGFARIDEENTEDTDVSQCIEEVVKILHLGENGKIELIREFQELPRIKFPGREINQCLLQVLKNAMDALEDKGTITLATAYVEHDELISIKITDNGNGMSPDVLRQAFHPFFTTREVGSGTGVGLSITERLIKRRNGRIRISSKKGEGTTVTLNLPAVIDAGRQAHQGQRL